MWQSLTQALTQDGAPAAASGSDVMAAWVHDLASYVALALDALAVLLVAAGAVIAAGRILRMAFGPAPAASQVRGLLIDFGRWLVAALTFQLGSDIVNTTIAPTWDELGWLAAVAGIRTFLTYFLDRDLERARREQHGEGAGDTAPAAVVRKTKV